MVDQREETLNYIQSNGPVLPIQIAKHLKTDTIFGSAVLSELVSRKILKITIAHVGGSPLYYLPGQEELMDTRLSNALGGREKQAYQLLKEKMIVRERDLEPWQRVAIKSLKDFAVPLNVNVQGNLDVFWKHHLITDEQAKLIISDILDQLYHQKEVVASEVVQTIVQETPKINEEIVSVPSQIKVEIPTIVDKTDQIIPEVKLPDPRIGTKIPEKREIFEETQQVLSKESEPVVEDLTKLKKPEGKFYHKVLEFIKDNKADILREEAIKKDKEFDIVINLNTGFGKLRYLIKAKNKASINEADVSSAFGEGQLNKLPVILLINGKVNKKAKLLVDTKMQGQLIIKEI